MRGRGDYGSGVRSTTDGRAARARDARRMTRLAPSPPAAATRLWLARGLAGLAAGLALLAVLGPLVTGVVDYRVSETLRHQTIGLDAVSLGLVAPLALAAAALV